ncbi:MAG TPA: hypothetical protein VL979_04550 [Solirubrobacteraceae bacterium]|nr:hypothetical protein [Solirubrobacteraceae bacterium]
MRTPLAYFAALVAVTLAPLELPGVAAATPTVAFDAKVVPIPGFAHTGNILGAGADLAFEYAIGGSEYFGSPPPIIAINVYAPKGTVLHRRGFPTCPEETLLDVGAIGCPQGSSAGLGTLVGFVTIGGERVEEHGELFEFFGPGGGTEYLADGHSPVELEILTKGRFSHLDGIDGYGFEEEEQVPLVATLPGAPYASVKTISATFGAARRSHGRTVYYGRVPKTCPRGGFPLKTEVIFAEDGEPSRPETVSAYRRTPCPAR